MSVSEVHAGVQRAKASRLIVRRTEGDAVSHMHLFEFVVHGVKYWLPPQRGQLSRGIPTAHAAAPLKSEIVSDDAPPVWPHPEGRVRGEALEPIYRSAPDAALRDPDLYVLLALVDAIRAGQARERKLAVQYLEEEWLE